MLPLLFILIALGIIIEAVSLKRDPAKIELDYSVSTQSTEPGMPFRIQTIITNKSLIPILYLATSEIYPSVAELPEGLEYQTKYDELLIKNVCSVSRRKRKRLFLEISILKRGLHAFRVDSVTFGDFLGFREIPKRVTLQREIIIYPKKLDFPGLTDALGRFCGDIASRRFLIRDPILTVGSREYTGREPMKEIHWLQSAHRGELMVREFDYNRQLNACVLLSTDTVDRLDEEELDRCCAAARTICETLIERGILVNFFTNAMLKRKSGREIWRCEVSSGYTGVLLEGLGRVSSFTCSSLETLLEYALRESEIDSAFIVILPPGEKRGEELLCRLRDNSSREVMLVHMSQLTSNNK